MFINDINCSKNFKNYQPPETSEENESEELVLQEHFDSREMEKFPKTFSSEDTLLQNLSDQKEMILKSDGSLYSDQKELVIDLELRRDFSDGSLHSDEKEAVRDLELRRSSSVESCHLKHDKEEELFTDHFKIHVLEKEFESKNFEELQIIGKNYNSCKQNSKKKNALKSFKKHDQIKTKNYSLRNYEQSSTNLQNSKDHTKSNEFLNEGEIFKDCLTDSDELRRRQAAGKEEYLNTPKKTESITTDLKVMKNPLMKKSKKSSKTETFLKDLNEKLYQHQQLPNNCEKILVKKNSKITKKLSLVTATTQSITLLPESVPHLVPNSSPNTTRLLPLKICPIKRKNVLRQTASCTNTSSSPMKAFILPLSMENLEICEVSSSPNIKSDSKRKYDKQEKIKYNPTIEENDEKKKTCTSEINKEIKVIKEPPQLKRNRSFTVIGLPDNYDPFLSAKRQLEELCSPSADSDELQNALSSTPKLPSMPATPNNKMTTSLILSSSAAATTNTTPSLMTTSQIPQQQQQQTQKTPVLARSSSFRRTASLRGPRRSPLLSSRPPLFAQKHRPTIQRGLSDEGPISTNFLKPEEYDEMPVRSVCVNDFALSKSPRVVRRDTSASNRKQPLKLNINAANNSNTNSNTNSPNVGQLEVPSSSINALKYVSKTDSLAVFLKFEHDLENSTNSEAVVAENLDLKGGAGPATNVDGPLSAKELKDKSNNLSKQNSNKNIKADIGASSNTEADKNLSHFSFCDVDSSKYGAVRLAPLTTKTSTPLSTKPSTPQLAAQQSPSVHHLTALNTKNSTDQNALKPNKPVALSSLIGGESKTSKQTSTLFYTERQNSNGSDYIDPKLINKCDNLPIHLNLKRNDYKYTDTDAAGIRLEQFSSSSSESSAEAKKTTSQIQQHQQPQQQHQQYNKLLPLVNPQQLQQEHAEPHTMTATTKTHVTNSQRNSAEGRNLLKRRMRVGRNQFLYDASPDGDSCSADDEGANRSSLEGDAAQKQLNSATRERDRAFERLSLVQALPLDAPFIPPLPAFDDFDFEEFLSSFENDEEQFPLFKDCREFLMNRTSKKQRSMLMPNSNSANNQTNTLNSCSMSSKKSPSPQTFPPLTPQTLTNNGQQPPQHYQQQQQQQHFQFPSLNQFNAFSSNTRTRNKYDDLSPAQMVDTFCLDGQKEEYRDLSSQTLNPKREIFISIETEQNDLDKTSISPNSIRHMVGNPQTVVEVEVDAAHDNKFSKISDDDDAAADGLHDPSVRSKNFMEHLPNVQLNNAKNLMQKMQENFRQLGDDMNTQLRMTKEPRTAPLDVNTNANSSNSRQMLNVKRTAGFPSGDAYVDSDELSSLDGYPLSSPNSRLGVSSKASADSAYGSLSRQRSSDLSTQRSSSRNRGMTTNTVNTLINRPLTEESSLTRLRQLSASSSSSSEHALPPITNNSSSSNSAYHKQYQNQQQQTFSNTSNNNNHKLNDMVTYESNNNNNNNGSYDNPPSLAHNLPSASNSQSNLESLQQFTSNSTMSTSMKMSRFCHECGNKFILEHAKFCMECGVKRIVL